MAQTKDGCGATISGGTARDWRDLVAALQEAQDEAQKELGLGDGEVVGRAFKREGGSTFAYLAAPGVKGAAPVCSKQLAHLKGMLRGKPKVRPYDGPLVA